ncbi:MAG TPA: hypothetical protein VF690_14390, partial [Hymenobacter sp.]
MLLIEFLLILALVAWQAVVFWRNRQLTDRVGVMYPAAGAVAVQPIPFTAANPEKNFAIQYDALITRDASPEFGQIVVDTNEYLLNNRGAAADFGILKDISERHAEALDEEIQAQIATPLYLGLLGTFTGAILGLVALVGNPFSEVSENPNTDTSFSNGDVQHFLGGVLIAMIGSLFGLAFT